MDKTTEAKNTTNQAAPAAPFPTFDPMQFWAQSQAQFQKLFTDAQNRWQSFADQYVSVEQQVTAHANAAVENWAKLAKDAIAYGVQLSGEARKLSVETAKKMGVNA